MKIQILNLVIPERKVQAFSLLFQTMFYLLLYSDAMNLGQSIENVFLVTLALSAREREKLRSTEDPLLKKNKYCHTEVQPCCLRTETQSGYKTDEGKYTFPCCLCNCCACH